MGKKEQKTNVRVVLDTNVLVSSLLFGGQLSGLVEKWMTGKIVPLASTETVTEFVAVLAYPKFHLSQDTIHQLLNEYFFPYITVVEPVEPVTGILSDTDDEIFLACALSGGAAYLVTGDRELLKLKEFHSTKIITPAVLLKLLES